MTRSERSAQSRRISRPLFGAFAGLSLLACLLAPAALFAGTISTENYRLSLLLASAGWFVFATLFQRHRAAALRKGVTK